MILQCQNLYFPFSILLTLFILFPTLSLFTYINTQRWHIMIQHYTCTTHTYHHTVQKRANTNTPITYSWYTIGSSSVQAMFVTSYFTAALLILAWGAKCIKSTRIYSHMHCCIPPTHKQEGNVRMCRLCRLCRRASLRVFHIVETWAQGSLTVSVLSSVTLVKSCVFDEYCWWKCKALGKSLNHMCFLIEYNIH